MSEPALPIPFPFQKNPAQIHLNLVHRLGV
jgi:hypothetical protein